MPALLPVHERTQLPSIRPRYVHGSRPAMRRYSFPWWLRAFLLIGAIEAIAIGLSGWLAPTGRAFDRFLPPAVSPLNGRVIGGFYLAGAVGLIASLMSRNASDARIFV